MLEDLELSLVLVLEVLASLAQFLGLEALQVVSVPTVHEVVLEGHRVRTSPSVVVSPGAGTPAAAAKAAAKAAKYGECPQG